MTLAFLADMNLSPATVERLREGGHEAIRSSDVLPATAPDDELLDYARANGLCVITFDLDFSALLALGGHSSPSVISLRLSFGDPDLVAQRLLEVIPFLEEELREGRIVTVDDQRIRIRNLPIGRDESG
jgi:predicted nuclease of predicted toxin-antitoxin system